FRLLIGGAEPFARGRNRLRVGPSLAKASLTTNEARSKSKLFSAFATADFNTFSTSEAAPRGVNFKIANASATLLPRMASNTRRTLRAETRTILAVALADVIFSAICYFTLLTYLSSCHQKHDHGKFE